MLIWICFARINALYLNCKLSESRSMLPIKFMNLANLLAGRTLPAKSFFIYVPRIEHFVHFRVARLSAAAMTVGRLEIYTANYLWAVPRAVKPYIASLATVYFLTFNKPTLWRILHNYDVMAILEVNEVEKVTTLAIA